jgi:CRP/FNR family transcriptional regulator, polysaccharide utilization system transcription regulator
MIRTGFALQLTRPCDTCMGCKARELSLLDELNQEELAIINRGRTRVTYKAGEPIFKEGTRPYGLLCMSQGKVKISINSVNGNELIVALKKPVDFIGFSDFIAEKSYSTAAHALEDTDVCVIMKEHFFSVAQDNSSLLKKINLHLVEELTQTRLRMAGITQKHMRGRLADALLYLHDTYGSTVDDNSVGAELKRGDIAALSNMTTANAIRTLSEFARDGLIAVNKRKIFLNRSQLNELYAISLQV